MTSDYVVVPREPTPEMTRPNDGMTDRERNAEVYRAMVSAAPSPWMPINTAPRTYSPPLSPVNHHAPQILGLWGQSFYFVCSWGGPSQPFWIGGDNKRLPFEPTRWMPLPEAPVPAPPSNPT